MNRIEKKLDSLINRKDTENPESLRKGRFFVASIILLILLAIPLAIYTLLFQPEIKSENVMIIAMIFLLYGSLCLYKLFSIRIVLANSIVVIFFYVLSNSYLTGGLFSSSNIWFVVYSCWIFLVADKKSGLVWFAVSLGYYVFLFYAQQAGLKNFRADYWLLKPHLTFINFFFSALFLAIIVYLHEKGKEKYLKELLLAKANIEEKNQTLEIQKQDIVSSINYASKIQNAILQQDEQISKYLPNSFVLYQAKHIVSGDFYFIKQVDDLLFIAAADCTGHGVPASLMTILGYTILNELITIHRFRESNLILDELRNRIKISLKQTGKRSETKDGMDIALCIIDTQHHRLQFSGANNGLLQINKDQVKEYKGDKMPIGIYPKERPFTKTEIQFSEEDSFYLYSDGYLDQFGGKDARKYKHEPFKQFLISIQNESMNSQKESLEKNFVQWKAHNEQTDDVLVIGFKINKKQNPEIV